MSKTDTIDLSSERLLSIAENALDDHDYIKALKMLNKNATTNGNDADSYMLYAEVFDDLDLSEKCINGWFKYIDYVGGNEFSTSDRDDREYRARLDEMFGDEDIPIHTEPSDDSAPSGDDFDSEEQYYEEEERHNDSDYKPDPNGLAEAYEGLAIQYMHLGRKKISAYYSDKMYYYVDVDMFGLDTPTRRKELWDSLEKSTPDLSIVYPPKDKDYTEEIDKGIKLMRVNDFENAVKEFEKVADGNEKYIAARNYIAMCDVICDKNDEAEQECLEILKRDPKNVHALTTLSAVKTQQKKTEEAKALAQKLISLNVQDEEDLYKVATVCCENSMHEEAYKIFCRLDDSYAYDCAFMFFKAIAAYNSGRIEESKNIFDSLLTIYPESIVADHWYSVMLKECKKKPEKRKPLEYFYRLPRSEAEANVALLTAFESLKDSQAKQLVEEIDMLDSILWCFDTTMDSAASGSELQYLGAVCALKAGYDDTVRDILLNAFASDMVKYALLTLLVERNEEGVYGITLAHLYKRVRFVPVTLGKLKRKIFIKAYALAFTRFSLLNTAHSAAVAAGCERLYRKLEAMQRLEVCRSVSDLAAAIIICSGVREKGVTKELLLSFFGAKESGVNKILDGII